jgi:Rrf2 family protein
LYRVLHRLVEAGLLHAVSGPGGGYMLARKPRAISLLDIVVAVEGPSTIAPLVAACPKHKRAIAAINKAAGEIAARTDRELEKIKLSRLIQER